MTSFIRVGLLFAELLFDFYAVRRYSVVIPLTAAGSLGAIWARGPSWGLNSGIRAPVALVRCLLSDHRCCDPLPSFFAWSFSPLKSRLSSAPVGVRTENPS